ncbi:MAG: hypothetical protein RLZZ350_375 [Verrucomicrobiota bacterium]
MFVAVVRIFTTGISRTRGSIFAIAISVSRATLAPMNKPLLIVLAIFIPPLAVYLKTNNVKTTLINLVLCFFFWLPGVIHALWTVLQ